MFDVIIVGGGMVGASLALSLAQQKLKVAVVENKPFSFSDQPSYNDRTIALSYGSKQIFEMIGAWEELKPYATDIQSIHISDQGHFGKTRLSAREECVQALGYVIESRMIGKVFVDLMRNSQGIEMLCPAEVTGFSVVDDHVDVEITSESGQKMISGRLLVGADGASSTVRQLTGLDVIHREYNQAAIIANVTTSQFHDHVAYERFTSSGPVALLPFGKDRFSMVCTVEKENAELWMSYSDEEFLQALQVRVGRRAGQFEKIGQRFMFPLQLSYARQNTVNRVVLIGNASHSLHPVAGQGFNLGLRDVSNLSHSLLKAHFDGQDIGSQVLLNAYAEKRKKDYRKVISLTDMMARVFTNPLSIVKMARNIGLISVDLTPPLKSHLAAQMMGLKDRGQFIAYR